MQQIVCTSSAGIVKKIICSGGILVSKQLEVIVVSQRTADSHTFLDGCRVKGGKYFFGLHGGEQSFISLK